MRLCTEAGGVKSYTHITEPAYEFPPEVAERLRAAVDELLTGKPLQYVLGRAEFYGRVFNVGPGVLIPRPETELLCRLAIEGASALYRPEDAPSGEALVSRDKKLRFPRPLRILDLCTGSGCIAWTMALELPGAEVTGVDISPVAIEIAENQPFESDNRPRFIREDIFRIARDADVADVKYDMILSNPPYIRQGERPQMHRNVTDWEPEIALFVPDDDPLRFYRAIAAISASHLSPGGFGMVEINESLPEETAGVFKDAGLSKVEIIYDLASKPRFIKYTLL